MLIRKKVKHSSFSCFGLISLSLSLLSSQRGCSRTDVGRTDKRWTTANPFKCFSKETLWSLYGKCLLSCITMSLTSSHRRRKEKHENIDRWISQNTPKPTKKKKKEIIFRNNRKFQNQLYFLQDDIIFKYSQIILTLMQKYIKLYI